MESANLVEADTQRMPARAPRWLPILAAFVFGAGLASLVWWRSGKSNETGNFPWYDAEGRITAWHEFVNGELVKMSEDRDLDGRRDAWHSYRNGRPTKSALDNNFDGKEDLWNEWDNTDGQIIRVDKNFDGTWDEETRCRMQIPMETRINMDFEGRPDALIRYENGIIATLDVIPGGGSTFLFRGTYVHGLLKEILADDNMDGVFDRKEVYDAMGRRLSDTPASPREAKNP